ncbi:MAG: hypothetical protein ACRDSR_27400 [Pseudonocardiaceae bacterium]
MIRVDEPSNEEPAPGVGDHLQTTHRGVVKIAMRELPQRGDTCGHVCGVLQTDIWAGCGISVADLIEWNPPAELLRKGTGDQSTGPGMRVPACEPSTDLHVVSTNRTTSPVAFTQLTHPPAEPLVADPSPTHYRC